MRIDPNVLGALMARRGPESTAMRHRDDGYKLGRLTQHRWAMFRNLLVALFRHERIDDHRGQGQGHARAWRTT